MSKDDNADGADDADDVDDDDDAGDVLTVDFRKFFPNVELPFRPWSKREESNVRFNKFKQRFDIDQHLICMCFILVGYVIYEMLPV